MPPARDLLYGSALYHLALGGPAPRALQLRLVMPWPGDRERGAALLAAGSPWEGDRPEEERARLHRFRWLADLAALDSDAAAQAAQHWTAQWLRRHDIYDGLAWRAELIGDRLFAWIEHFDLLTAGDGSSRALLAGFARQARHLSRVAATEGTGLARLKALRGLVAAAAALGGGRRLARALRLLARETGAQILADGGHAGRGPASQLATLACLVDARAALLAAGAPVPEFLQQAIERAAPMLRLYRHGDGRFALFNGAAEGDPAMIDLVLARADAKGRTPLTAPDTGFERLQAGGTVVLLDCGRPAPPGLDASAHAGTLSFEMSHGRERIIVNCGAYPGASAEWRAAMRASAAHSTLIVADTNSLEIGADGRIAEASRTVTHQRAEQDGSLWVAATHDFYRGAFGLTHGRQLFLAADGDDLRGEDSLTGAAGSGFAIRFHLHPSVEPALLAEGNSVLLRLPSGGVWRLRAEGAVLSLGESIYMGSGTPQKTQQILLDGHVGSNGGKVRWAIRREIERGIGG